MLGYSFMRRPRSGRHAIAAMAATVGLLMSSASMAAGTSVIFCPPGSIAPTPAAAVAVASSPWVSWISHVPPGVPGLGWGIANNFGSPWGSWGGWGGYGGYGWQNSYWGRPGCCGNYTYSPAPVSVAGPTLSQTQSISGSYNNSTTTTTTTNTTNNNYTTNNITNTTSNNTTNNHYTTSGSYNTTTTNTNYNVVVNAAYPVPVYAAAGPVVVSTGPVPPPVLVTYVSPGTVTGLGEGTNGGQGGMGSGF